MSKKRYEDLKGAKTIPSDISVSKYGDIIGHATRHRFFPVIVERNKHLFRDVKTVLDIGAGWGRFAKWFLSNFPNIEEYVAIEPSTRLVHEMQKYVGGDRRLKIINDSWQDVRDKLGKYDVVIFWDVLMYMNVDPFETIEEIISHAKKYFLFSLHPPSLISVPTRHSSEVLKKLLSYLDSHPCLELIDKMYWNRLYRVRC